MSSSDRTVQRIWAVLPAAGIGKRMQSVIPKQYLDLNGRPVLEHTVNTLLQSVHISGLVIALQADDNDWARIRIDSDKPVLRAPGGAERADSVLNALDTLLARDDIDADTVRVMVHDAVRPCLRQGDIDRLVHEVGDSADGGLLALPVRDTMKRQGSDSDRVAETIDRERLWHALTPQYFPALALRDALRSATAQGLTITDESSAMESAGYRPLLVTGHEDNIKITRPDDLRLAGLYLQSLQSQAEEKHDGH